MDSRRTMKRFVKLPGLPEVVRHNVGTSRIIDTRIRAPPQQSSYNPSKLNHQINLQKHSYQPQRSPILQQPLKSSMPPPQRQVLSPQPYIQPQQQPIQTQQQPIQTQQPPILNQQPLTQPQHTTLFQQPHIDSQQQTHILQQPPQIQTQHLPNIYPQENYYITQQHKTFIESVKRLDAISQRLENLVKILIERTNENNTLDLEDSTEVLADISMASRDYLSRHKILR